MVMPGDRFMQNFQITFYKNGTFSESGGLPMQGTWVQSGHLVTIREDRLSLGDKSFSLGKGVTTSDLQVSGDGKTLSGLGRDRIKYSRD